MRWKMVVRYTLSPTEEGRGIAGKNVSVLGVKPITGHLGARGMWGQSEVPRWARVTGFGDRAVAWARSEWVFEPDG